MFLWLSMIDSLKLVFILLVWRTMVQFSWSSTSGIRSERIMGKLQIFVLDMVKGFFVGLWPLHHLKLGQKVEFTGQVEGVLKIFFPFTVKLTSCKSSYFYFPEADERWKSNPLYKNFPLWKSSLSSWLLNLRFSCLFKKNQCNDSY